jgi:hypothetical protein
MLMKGIDYHRGSSKEAIDKKRIRLILITIDLDLIFYFKSKRKSPVRNT